MVHRIRLGSGLVLLAFLIEHMLNHALGLVSVGWATAAVPVLLGPWQTAPGQILLAAAALLHVGIALLSLYRRRSLTLRPAIAAQYLLGLSLPPLLIYHVMGTRVVTSAFGANATYENILLTFWYFDPVLGIGQAVVLLAAWVHACVGLYLWLGVRPHFERWRGTFFAAASALPSLALGGYVAGGMDMRERAADAAWLNTVFANARFTEAAAAFLPVATWVGIGIYVVLLAATLLARLVRRALEYRRRLPRLTYGDGRVLDIIAGATVLETVLAAGIPHAAMCGGRGRCSTCRVIVEGGVQSLPPPSPQEAKVLKRIRAVDGVRLACQLRPVDDVTVRPLLPPGASARDGITAAGSGAGEEREIAILFADMRGFTRLSDGRLPYDIVFLLNRYFAAMGQAVEEAGGRLDKFIGDGVMALFGLDHGIELGCRQALAASTAMGRAIDRMSASLEVDLSHPLRLAIGIHAGPCIVGTMGYGTARGLTAIGDAVNVASRLESVAKALSVDIVVGSEVATYAGLDLSAYPVRDVDIRGKAAPVAVHVIDRCQDLPQTLQPVQPVLQRA